MGLADMFSEILSSLSFSEAYAEAPAADVEEDSVEAEEVPAEVADEEEEKEEAEEVEEEEEEEEEEPEDVKPKLEAECANSSHCAPVKHHFDECVERVTQQLDDPDHKGPKEDCVEEFFHLQHCATQCAAPKLFKILA